MNFTRAEAHRVAEILRAAAATEILPRYRNLSAGAIRQKTSRLDLVTDADEAAETAIAAELLRAFPGALVVGEEAVSRDRSRLDGLGEAELLLQGVLDLVDLRRPQRRRGDLHDVVAELRVGHGLDRAARGRGGRARRRGSTSSTGSTRRSTSGGSSSSSRSTRSHFRRRWTESKSSSIVETEVRSSRPTWSRIVRTSTPSRR